MPEKFNQSFNIHKSIDILVFLVNSVQYEQEKSNNFQRMAANVLQGFVIPVNKNYITSNPVQIHVNHKVTRNENVSAFSRYLSWVRYCSKWAGVDHPAVSKSNMGCGPCLPQRDMAMWKLQDSSTALFLWRFSPAELNPRYHSQKWFLPMFTAWPCLP